MWLRQPSAACFTVGFHALSQSQPIILATEHHTRLFCHPRDADNPIYPHHLTKAAELHTVLSTVPRQNAVWAALRAFWAALTSYAGDLRYPLFWQGLESLFGSEEKTWKVTVRLCTRLSSFLSEDQATRQLNYSKAEACYDARSKIIHGRWDVGTKIDQLMADTEAIARTVMRHVLEKPGMLDIFISERRDDFLEALVQSSSLTHPTHS